MRTPHACVVRSAPHLTLITPNFMPFPQILDGDDEEEGQDSDSKSAVGESEDNGKGAKRRKK